MYLNDTYLSPCGVQVIHNLLCRITDRAHGHQDLRCVRRTIVIKGLIVGADLRVHHIHIFYNRVHRADVRGVACFTMLEEGFRLLRRAQEMGMLGIQGMLTEAAYCVPVHHFPKVLIIPYFDLLVLMRGTEAVEEMHHGKLSCDGSQMGYCRQVHDLLNAIGAEHGETGLPAAHNIGMVTEDGQSMGSQGTGSHMEHRRGMLAGQLIHIRDHQEQTLGCCKGGGISACSDGSVYGTCRTTLGFHLNDIYLLTEEILSSGSRPLIHAFRHGGGRRDGIDR